MQPLRCTGADLLRLLVLGADLLPSACLGSNTALTAHFCRDRVHQVSYLRNSLAHSAQPTLAESVAGAMAVMEVLRDHGQHQRAQEVQTILQELQEASWLQPGPFPLLPDLFPSVSFVQFGSHPLCW